MQNTAKKDEILENNIYKLNLINANPKNEVIFVTHNKGKIASAKKQLKEVNFKIYEYELEEPRSDDIKYISKYKVKEAYKLVKKPCISLDCGFWIDELDGFPRAFVNFAQMTDEERANRIKYQLIDSMQEFAKWYRNKLN